MNKPNAFHDWSNKTWRDYKGAGPIRDWQQRVLAHKTYEKALGRAFWNAAIRKAAKHIRNVDWRFHQEVYERCAEVVEALLEEDE